MSMMAFREVAGARANRRFYADNVNAMLEGRVRLYMFMCYLLLAHVATSESTARDSHVLNQISRVLYAVHRSLQSLVVRRR